MYGKISTRIHPSLVFSTDNTEELFLDSATSIEKSFHTSALDPTEDDRTRNPLSGDFESLEIFTD